METGKENLYSKDDLTKFFQIQSTLQERASAIARLCTPICPSEYITELWIEDDEDDLYPGTVGIGVWNPVCQDNDCYHIPIEYFSMSTDEIKKAEQKKKALEEIERKKEAKRQQKAEEARERAEYARLRKKFGWKESEF